MATMPAEMAGARDALDTCSAEAIEELTSLVSERLPYFRRMAFRRLDNAADAEDAVQDAFLNAWKHLDKFKREAQMSTWMTAVVMNSARMVARKRSRSPQHFMEGQNLKEGSVPLAEMLPDRRPGPEEAACQRDLEHRSRRLSAHLPPNLRDVIQLCGIDGHSIREAAEVLGLTITAVKSRSMRARKELRRLDRMNPADRREPGR